MNDRHRQQRDSLKIILVVLIFSALAFTTILLWLAITRNSY